MTVNTPQNLKADIKRLLESAKEDYKQNCLHNHSYYVSELNPLIKRARDLNSEIDVAEVEAAENDEVVHTSHTAGMPYNPRLKPSYESKTKKLREVINVAEKLYAQISPMIETDTSKKTKKTRAISQLQKLIGTIDNLKASRHDSGEFKKWKRNVEIAVENIFSKDQRHLEDLSIQYYPLSGYSARLGIPSKDISDEEYQTAYKQGLETARLVLQSMIEEIEAYWDDETSAEEQPTPTKSTGEIIELICNRFHSVSRQLKKRHKGRPTLEINDEYDAQDLMRSLLHLFFDDIRPEEHTPKYAGKSARVDFLLKVEKTVLELKHSRPSLTETELGDELIIDIRRYKETHPDCQSLYCFVYDPEGYIDNPRGMENDLSRLTEGMPVKVIIAPKTH
jgi:hypothetical protein